MNKQITLLIFFFCVGTLAMRAQSKQDSLFLSRIVSNPELVEGKAYLLETEKQKLSSEHGKSRFIKASDEPAFDLRGELTNSLHYSVFGDSPITYNGFKTEKVKIDKEKYDCAVLSFTCKGQQYKAYDPGFTKPHSRLYYRLIEADLLKELQTQLVGKTFYTRTANWWQYDETRMNSNLKLTKAEEGTCKYCPVTVTRVVNNYNDYYIVLFRQGAQGREYCFDDIEINDKTGISTDFMRYFTFENPKARYPKISAERWEQIKRQKITKGFTPEEVKAAYGKADEVMTENDDETWVYYNHGGKDYAVYFKGGVVDKVVSQTTRLY